MGEEPARYGDERKRDPPAFDDVSSARSTSPPAVDTGRTDSMMTVPRSASSSPMMIEGPRWMRMCWGVMGFRHIRLRLVLMALVTIHDGDATLKLWNGRRGTM